MRKNTFQKLDLAAQRIADRLLGVQEAMHLVVSIKKPYANVKQMILDNQELFDKDMYGVLSMKNICKTTRQIHYLTNEVLHRLRRAKFFTERSKKANAQQMLLPL